MHEKRVNLGSGWLNKPSFARLGLPVMSDSSDQMDDLGFRLVRTITPVQQIAQATAESDV